MSSASEQGAKRALVRLCSTSRIGKRKTMRPILHRNTQTTPTRSNLVNPMWLATVAVARHGRT
eukprot:5649993-Pleurochrysis_carterae.AAC.1